MAYLTLAPSTDFVAQLSSDSSKMAKLAGVTLVGPETVMQQLLLRLEHRNAHDHEANIAQLRHALRLLQQEGEQRALVGIAQRAAAGIARV